jgi:hypothetical protein
MVSWDVGLLFWEDRKVIHSKTSKPTISCCRELIVVRGWGLFCYKFDDSLINPVYAIYL